MEALSKEFWTSCSWELLYADDLVIVAEEVVTLESGAWVEGPEGEHEED